MSCETCVDALFMNNTSANFYSLTRKNDNGGLSYPFSDMVKILRIAECIFKHFLGEKFH